MSKEVKKVGVKIVSAWFFSLLFIIISFQFFIESYIAGIFMLLAGLIIFPLITEYLKKKHKFELTSWLKVIIVIILLILAIAFLPYEELEKQPESSAMDLSEDVTPMDSEKDSDLIFSLNEPIIINDFEYIFTKYYTTPYIGSEYLGKEASGIFIIFDLEVTNLGNSADYINNEIYIIDEQGREFSQDDDAWIYLDDNFIFEELNPGLTKKGQIIFDVPEGIKGYLGIKKSMWGSDYEVFISWAE